MSTNETIFYICGGVLAVSAVVVSIAGLKFSKFPGKFLPVIILWFAVFVVSATTFATRYSGEEHEKHAAEYAAYFEKLEESETSSPSESEAGGESGESEKVEAKGEGTAQKEPAGKPAGTKEAKGGGAETTLELEASPTALEFNTTHLEAKAGKVTIDFTNPAPLEHNVVIEQNGKELAGFEPIAEGKASESANLKPGTYTFFCAVPGHRQAGMEGTLVVK